MADLSDDLRALGRSAVTASDTDTFTARVMAAVPTPGVTRPSLRRRLAIAAVVVLLALVGTPPVRAAIADWFGFGGVKVEQDQSPPGDDDDAAPPVVGGDGGPSVTEAATRVGFPLLLPEALGAPDGVEVSADRRVVSMSWELADRTLRVDQFDGTVDFTLVKQAPRLRFVSVDGQDALWFPLPHRLTLLGADGAPASRPRVAGHTLVLPGATTTFRLEGAGLRLARAVEIARSVEPVT